MLELIKKKRGVANPIYSAIIFIIFNLFVFSAVFLFVAREGSNAAVYEEVYAKRIALLIDSIKPGTHLEIDVSDIVAIARDKSVEPYIKIDCDKNEVIVKASSKGGYAYRFFNDMKECSYSFDKENRKLVLGANNE